jgi:hypothetical protein
VELKKYLLIIAIREVEHIKKENKFVVADLFRKSDWDFIPLSIRKQVGNDFFTFAKANPNIIISIGKSNDPILGDINQQIYQKL